MNKAVQYNPDYIVPPGEVLEDYLEAHGMSQAELAVRLGVHKKTVNEIVKAKAPITTDMALKLEKVFQRTAHFWGNLEAQYREGKARADEAIRLEEGLGWLKRVPVSHMIKHGWIKKFASKTEQLNEVLSFYGVASQNQWQEIWQTHQVAYRQSQAHKANAEAVSAWLRRGELEAQKIVCGEYDREGFISALAEARHWTRDLPQDFVPKIIKRFSAVGVAVVFVPELPKTGVSGATRWIGGKAVIQLSLRYKRADQLWFTFFHEAGHILKHGRKLVFLEGNGMDDEKEQEANAFAANHLVPPSEWREFTNIGDYADASIVTFADYLGIAPGIVVGRLQREKLLPFSKGTDLFMRLKWASS